MLCILLSKIFSIKSAVSCISLLTIFKFTLELSIIDKRSDTVLKEVDKLAGVAIVGLMRHELEDIGSLSLLWLSFLIVTAETNSSLR